MAATSSFTEGSSVFGGQANLMEAIGNIFSIYNPDVIAVHTTCLSETIGDDVPQIIAKARDEGKIPKGKYVIHASTPSYVGSHVTGFANMVKGMVQEFAAPTNEKSRRVNIIPGFVEPSDMTELKRIASLMGVSATLFPDTSEVLDTPQTGRYEMYPRGGATIGALKSIGASQATLALGPIASGPGAKLLDTKCKVHCDILKLPIGLKATDAYVDKLRTYGGSVPDELELERGQLLDVITDMQQYFHGKKAALVGDPDQLIPLAEFLTDIGMEVRHAITGSQGKKFNSRMKEAVGKDDVNTRDLSDMFYLHQLILNEPVDLIFGNTYAKYMSRDMGIPLIRTGFPIYDRVGHQYFPTLGYKGALRLLEKIVTALLDKSDASAPEEKFELTL